MKFEVLTISDVHCFRSNSPSIMLAVVTLLNSLPMAMNVPITTTEIKMKFKNRNYQILENSQSCFFMELVSAVCEI